MCPPTPFFFNQGGWEGWNRFVKERVGLIGEYIKGKGNKQ
jgi:hypothetical protein